MENATTIEKLLGIVENINRTLPDAVEDTASTVINHIQNLTENVFEGVENVTQIATNVSDTSFKSPMMSTLARYMTFTNPVIMVVGFICNILSCVTVSSRHCKKSSFTVLIAALAMSDSLALLVNGLQTWPLVNEFIRSIINTVQFWCKFLQFLTFFPANISTYLVTAMTIERFVCTYFPVKARLGFGPKTGYLIVGIIIAINLCLYGHLLYGFTLKTTQGVTVCTFLDSQYSTFYRNVVVSYLGFGAFFVLPFLVIVFCNTAIIVKAFRLGPNPDMSVIGQHRREQRIQILRTVLVVSVCFLILVSPFTLYMALRQFSFEADGHVLPPQEDNTDAVLVYVFGQLLFLNYSLNFFLYVMTGSKFRNDLKKAICN